jgi:hypothetical protein
MTELVYKNNGGFGNLLIQLTSLQEECKQLHDHVFGYELSNCLTINGFTRVSREGKQPECPIYINQFTVNHVHPKIRDIIKPTPFMEELISKHKHLVEGVCCGIGLRRGSYSEDSRQFDSKESEDASHYFCSDEGLKKFQDVIEEAPGPVFVSSDSKSTLNMLIEKYGDKIRYFKTDFTVGAHQDFRETTISDYHNIYLKFFLLSMCPQLFLTGGRGDMIGFSTYAYMAAIYGKKPFQIIFN